MNTYKVSELIVLHLSAGKDGNGNPRRCYVLAHPLDGFLDATDEGYEGEHAVRAFAQNWLGSPGDHAGIFRELLARIATKIDTTPSMYRHFVSRRMTSKIEYAITV